MIQFSWGIRPAVVGLNATGTYMAKEAADGTISAMTAEEFNASYELRFIMVGDGSYSEAKGYAFMDTWFTSALTTAKDRTNDSSWAGGFSLEVKGSSYSLPMNYFGTYNEDDYFDENDDYLDTYVTEDEFYANLWHSKWVDIVVYNKQSGKLHRISETQGGLDRPLAQQLNFNLTTDSNMILMNPGMDYNNPPIYAQTESKRIFVGAELPGYCVWLDEAGYKSESVLTEAGYSAAKIQEAYLLDVQVETHDSVDLVIAESKVEDGKLVLSGRARQRLVDGSYAAFKESARISVCIKGSSDASDFSDASVLEQALTTDANGNWSITIEPPESTGNSYFVKVVITE